MNACLHAEDLEQTIPTPSTVKSGLINYKVFVRCRPLTEREVNASAMDPSAVGKRQKVVRKNENTLYLYEPDASITVPQKFEFEHIFLENDHNIDVYRSLGESIESFLAGFNTSILAYGMTGAGKSHTMFGSQYCEEYEEEGLISLVVREIMARLTDNDQLKMSFMELYNEQLRDLLVERSSHLALMEDAIKGTTVSELSQHEVNSYEDFVRLLKNGCSRRAVAATASNANSSRSHSIIQISCTRIRGNESFSSKLFFVDLAGSERASQTKGIRQQEGSNINKSLLALGNCINSLGESNRGFVPYRDSKLTRLLKDSLGGNSKTVLIVCISPSAVAYEETLNALKYASRALKIRREVTPNVKQLHHESQLEYLRKEVARLRQLLNQRDKENIPQASSKQLQENDRLQKLRDYSPKLIAKSRQKERKIEKEMEALKKALVKKDLLLMEKDDNIKKLEIELNKYRQKSTRLDINQSVVTPTNRCLLDLVVDPPPSLQVRVERQKSRPKSSSRCLTPTTKHQMLGLQAVRQLSRQFKISLKQLYTSYQALKGERMPAEMVNRINQLSAQYSRGNIKLSQEYSNMLAEFCNLIRFCH